MTAEEVKKILRSVKETERNYRFEKNRMNAYKESLESGKCIRYNNDGSKTEKNGNPVEKALLLLAEYEEKTSTALNEMIETRCRVEKYINRLPRSSEREALTRHYVCGESLQQTADNMHYSRANIIRLCNIAISKLAKLS